MPKKTLILKRKPAAKFKKKEDQKAQPKKRISRPKYA
jgi:hypothetical protein